MVESADEPPLLDSPRSIPINAHASSKPIRAGIQRPAEALKGPVRSCNVNVCTGTSTGDGKDLNTASSADAERNDVAEKSTTVLSPSAPPPPENGQGTESASLATEEKEEKPNFNRRLYSSCKSILFCSWLNVLLVFVPIAIIVEVIHIDQRIVFAMNAIAIIPLAGLLSYATESVASDLGDTIGALMNVTFGNAVELIIFMYVLLTDTDKREPEVSSRRLQLDCVPRHLLLFPNIALTKNEIRIVQASLLGSILANLLLILGMCFLLGGLRFREQIYNNTVTQTSACLLSLSVMSLLLPTAFYASFQVQDEIIKAAANTAVLQVSRGTSVILLLVYVLYLLFQLKSHKHLYQSTPQHVIDEESHPGLLHDLMDSSSSSDTSSSSTSSDSDESSGSHTTAQRIKKVLRRGRRRRKSSAGSNDATSVPSTIRTPSVSTFGALQEEQEHAQLDSRAAVASAVASGDEADDDDRQKKYRKASRQDATITFRDFEKENAGSGSQSPEIVRKTRSKRKHHKREVLYEKEAVKLETAGSATASTTPLAPLPHVGHTDNVEIHENCPKRPFNIRGLSVRDALPVMPAMPKVLSTTVFSSANPTGMPPPPTGPVATAGIKPRALHRSSSLPSRLNQATRQAQSNPPLQPQIYMAPVGGSAVTFDSDDPKEKKKNLLSRTAAILLLVFSTALVAVCAEFLVGSIDYLVDNSSVSEIFVGLIIIPIVGNAAEHVCAVTVATKNKMDLAIGVAVGSSIQIALFVTPVIVLLGWILNKDMGLYFSLFETVSLFVSAFIVNFLVLDGRSNYLEGALLIAAYVIIAVAAFFYPDEDEQSQIGGAARRMMMAMI